MRFGNCTQIEAGNGKCDKCSQPNQKLYQLANLKASSASWCLVCCVDAYGRPRKTKHGN